MDVTITQVVAWIGGCTGLASLTWNIYTWFHRGAIVHVDVSPDMLFRPPLARGEEDKDYVFVTAVNRGAQPTTITNVVGFWYRTRLQRLRRKPEKSFFVGQPQPGYQPLPHILKPGEQWTGAFEQEPARKFMAEASCWSASSTRRRRVERSRVS